MPPTYGSVTSATRSGHFIVETEYYRNMKQTLFTRLGRFAVARPRAVLAATGVFFVLAGVVGSGVISHLSTGGFDDTSSQGPRAAAPLQRVFHQGNPDVVLMVHAKQGGVDDAAVAAEGRRITDELAHQ